MRLGWPLGRGVSAVLIFGVLAVASQSVGHPVGITLEKKLAVAKFFLKYFDMNFTNDRQPASISEWRIDVPSWFRSYCRQKRIPVSCEETSYSQIDFDKLLTVFEKARYNSLIGGAINEAFKVAKLNPAIAFDILKDTINRFDTEFQFSQIAKNQEEEKMWEHLNQSLPLIKTHSFRLKDQNFRLDFRGEGLKRSMQIFSSDGRLAFRDGPREIDAINHLRDRRLSTSMTMTWTDPDFRSFGIYQYALRFYITELRIKNIYLHTENPETLEFIYRIKLILNSELTRHQMLRIPGFSTYLQAFNVDLVQFEQGNSVEVLKAESALGYLSLQGRTRVSAGLSFVVDFDDYSTIYSNTIPDETVTKIRADMKAFETVLQDAINETDVKKEIELLPKSYLAKFKKANPAVPPNMCDRLLGS